MNLLDRLLGHDSWTTKQLLSICERLDDEQLDRDFDIGHRTIRRTLDHLIFNVEAWCDCLAGRPIRAQGGTAMAELIDRLDAAASELANLSRQLDAQGAWDDNWIDPSDGQSRSYGGTVLHVITHSMHHRAQLLYLLRLVGAGPLPEGDVLSWEQQIDSSRTVIDKE